MVTKTSWFVWSTFLCCFGTLEPFICSNVFAVTPLSPIANPKSNSVVGTCCLGPNGG